MSSGAALAPGFRRAAGKRRVDESRTAPMLYRANPMVYEPPERFCNCNPPRKAPRWISWSVLNLGRRYYACIDALNGRGCGYVEWHDPPLPKFWSELLGDLRDEVWRLRGQETVPTSSEERGRDASSAMVLALQEELKEKNTELAAVKGKFESIVYAVILFVLGLVVGKLVLA
ncbi:hypothetical protein ACQ4PT_056965 [Festuca glaucescens]